MERFVLLRLHDMERDEDTERWINLRMVRQFEPSRNDVLLNGSQSPVRVSCDSMERLVRMVEGLNEAAEIGLESSRYHLAVDKAMHDAVIRERVSLWMAIKRLFSMR